MSDEFATNQAVIAAGVGGVAGLGGAAVTALSENMTRKQVCATVISGLAMGYQDGGTVLCPVLCSWQLSLQ
jgi:hypothetical protein